MRRRRRYYQNQKIYMNFQWLLLRRARATPPKKRTENKAQTEFPKRSQINDFSFHVPNFLAPDPTKNQPCWLLEPPRDKPPPDRESQDSLKSRPERARTGPRRPRRRPRRLQDASKTSKTLPKTSRIALDGPRHFQTCPRALQPTILVPSGLDFDGFLTTC